MKDLPKVFIIAGIIIIFILLFFYLYFLKKDIIRLKSALKNEVKKGDIILFFPDWEKNDILSLDGLPIITSQENQYLNLYGFNRLFLIKNTKHYKKTSIPIINELLLNKKSSIYPYDIEEYRLPAFNLSDRINELRVSVSDEKTRNICPKEHNKFICGEKGWQYIGLTTVDINGQTTECIWAHPIGKKKIIIEADIPAAIAGDFILYRALASTSGFDHNKPEIIIEIFINNEPITSYKVSNSREWQKNKFSYKKDRAINLRMEITTPQEYKHHLCINMEAF